MGRIKWSAREVQLSMKEKGKKEENIEKKSIVRRVINKAKRATKQLIESVTELD